MAPRTLDMDALGRAFRRLPSAIPSARPQRIHTECPKWTADDAAAALEEGWDLVATDDGLRIRADRSARTFLTHDDAVWYVAHHAKAGSQLHEKALMLAPTLHDLPILFIALACAFIAGAAFASALGLGFGIVFAVLICVAIVTAFFAIGVVLLAMDDNPLTRR